MLAVRHGANRGGGQKQVGGCKVGKGERERERNSICLKTCRVHYMLQKSLFEVCNVNGFLRAFIVLWGLQKWHSHR